MCDRRHQRLLGVCCRRRCPCWRSCGRRSWLLGLVAASVSLGLLLALPAAGREHRYGDVVIRVLPDLPQSTTHGYHEFPFQVINESASSRRVTLMGPDALQTGIGMHSLRVLERTVTVGPGSSVRLALLQPPLPVFGSGLRVTIDGRRQGEVIPWTSGHPEYWIGPTGVAIGNREVNRSRRVLISQGLSEDEFPPHKPEEYWIFRAVMPLEEWSSNWLAYSGYDGMLITAPELAEAPGPVIEALWHYIETGGSMLVLGRLEAESSWDRARRSRVLASRDEKDFQVAPAKLEIDYAGFGEALIAADASRVADLSPAQLERLQQAWSRSRKLWDRARDPAAAHRQFAVADHIEIPVRGLFLLVFAFTVLVGPVNLALLTRWGKRDWLLWTVPAASLLTCALVVLYVLAGEGWVRYGRTEGLTVLDERTHRATTFGWTGFYATLTPGDGLRFGNETEVSPVVSWARGQRDGGVRAVAWGDQQHLSRGWLRARLPSYFIVRKSEVRRERIRLRRRGDGIEAVNGLGADLETLWVVAEDGRLHTARDLVAGAAVPLEVSDRVAVGGPDVLREIYRGDLPSRLLRMAQDPESYLRPGTWLAVAQASPFLETALEDLDRRGEKAVIYGIAQDKL